MLLLNPTEVSGYMSLFNIIHQFPGTVRSLIDEIEQEWCETIEELYPDLELPELPRRAKRSEYRQLQKQVAADQVLEDWPDLDLPDLPPELPELILGVTPLDELPGVYGTGEYWANRILELMSENLYFTENDKYEGIPFSVLAGQLADRLDVVPDMIELEAFFTEVLHLENLYGLEGRGNMKPHQFRGYSTHSRTGGILNLYVFEYASDVASKGKRTDDTGAYALYVWENSIELCEYDFETQSVTSL